MVFKLAKSLLLECLSLTKSNCVSELSIVFLTARHRRPSHLVICAIKREKLVDKFK